MQTSARSAAGAQPATHAEIVGPWVAATAAVALAGCGGGEPAPAAFFRTADASSRRDLLAAAEGPAGFRHPSPAAAAGAVSRLPTVAELLDWAERQYPQLFPGHEADVVEPPYIYRHYPATGNYVGVADGQVYVLGPVSEGRLLHVGAVSDFAAQVLVAESPADDAAAARFLQQAQFSSTESEIAAVRAAGYRAWLRAEFARPRGQTTWDWLVQRGYGRVDDPLNFEGGSHVDFGLWHDLFTSAAQVRARLALALSEFFVVALNGINGLQWNGLHVARYWDLLTQHATGTYRALLEAVTLSHAMGGFLNTLGNEKEDATTGRQPDENYAREVLQLFSIGLVMLSPDGTPRRDAAGRTQPTYTQEDITNLARVFTGWEADTAGQTDFTSWRYPVFDYRHTQRPMRLNPAKHSALPARFLGTTIAANTPGAAALTAALDAIAAHPNVGPFFGRQMIQRLVTSDPSPAYVARVSAVFDDNGQGVRGDLAAVFEAILTDVEARGEEGLRSTTHGKLREPMHRLTQWGRTFGVESAAGSWKLLAPIYAPRYSLGQSPLQAPSVFNFFRPGYVPPGTAMAEARSTAPEFQIVSETTVAAYVNFINAAAVQGIVVQNPDQPGIPQGPAVDVTDIKARYLRELSFLPDADALVRHLNLVLCAGQLSPATQALIADALRGTGALQATDPQVRYWLVGTAVTMVLVAPEYLVQK